MRFGCSCSSSEFLLQACSSTGSNTAHRSPRFAYDCSGNPTQRGEQAGLDNATSPSIGSKGRPEAIRVILSAALRGAAELPGTGARSTGEMTSA